MGGRVNYAIVGVFVILLTAMVITVGLWLSELLTRHAAYDTYITYLDESVSGLNINSPVRLNGIVVGFVEQISLNKNNLKQVKLVLNIQQGTPITEDTQASLRMRGLTGIAYVELDPQGKNNQLLHPTSTNPTPVIQSTTSFFNNMQTEVTKLAKNLTDISDSLHDVLNHENQRNLQQGLAKLNQTLDYVNKIAHNTEMASHHFPEVVDSIQRSADAFATMTTNIDQTSAQVAQTMQDGELAIETMSTQVMPVAVDLLTKLQVVMTNLGLLSGELRQNPSMLIRGRNMAALGPGEQSVQEKQK